MKLKNKTWGFDGVIGYLWEVEEIKTEKECIDLLVKIAEKLGAKGFNFWGYEDMDEHGNEVSFDTVKEMLAGADEIKRIEPDSAATAVVVDGKQVEIEINPFWDNEKGTRISVVSLSEDEKAIKLVSAKVKKIVEDNFS